MTGWQYRYNTMQVQVGDRLPLLRTVRAPWPWNIAGDELIQYGTACYSNFIRLAKFCMIGY
jgi:hypothetical protein